MNRGKTPDVEKSNHRSGTHDGHGRRVRSGSARTGSHSRTSSRSITPTAEGEDGTIGHVRGGNTTSNASDRRKKMKGSLRKLTPAEARSATPDVPSPLVRENSFTSVSSLDTDRPVTPSDGNFTRSTKMSFVKEGGTPSRKGSSTRSSK